MTYFFPLLEQHGLTAVIGIRTEGLIAASVIPLALTMILFLGPIAMLLSNERLRMLFHPSYWSQSLTDLIWWRNHVVAPFTEELAFRYVIILWVFLMRRWQFRYWVFRYSATPVCLVALENYY